MPNILKRYLGREATPYEYQPAQSLVVEAPPPALDQEEGASGQEDSPFKGAASTPAARTPVDYAKLQADAILADAQQQAQEMLERARAEVEPELEVLRASAQQDGYQAGYVAGLSDGADRAIRDRQDQAAELADQVATFLQRATQAQEDLLTDTQDELKDLAISVAEKVVKVSLKSSGEIVGRMIQGATEKLKRKQWVRIYIAGCDAKRMAQMAPGLTQSLAALSDHVRIVPMTDDESGTCIIEMPDEIIDASAATQLSNIRGLLNGGRGPDS